MTMRSGKIAENIEIKVAQREEQLGSVTVYWNGQSITSASGYGVDTLGYREAIWRLGVGTIQGQVASLVAAVYESDTDDPTAATAISGADFTTMNASSDEAQEVGSVLVNPRKRYQFLRLEVQNSDSTNETATIHVSSQCILGDKQTDPVGTTLTFDIES